MEKIINKQDIQQFLIQEKKKPIMNEVKKSIHIYINCLYTSFIDIKDKLKDIEGINNHSLITNASIIITNIFWIVYSNSFNLKLTLFLIDRAILLYTEFIIISKNPILNNDSDLQPDMNDAMLFSLKKIIGNIKINISTKNKKINELLNHYYKQSMDIKLLYSNLFLLCDIDILSIYEKLSKKIIKQNNISYMNNVLNSIKEPSNEKIKLIIELYPYLHNNTDKIIHSLEKENYNIKKKTKIIKDMES